MGRCLEGVTFSETVEITFSPRPDSPPQAILPLSRIYCVTHPRRSLVRIALCSLMSLRILFRERPKWVISTGADVTVPAFILSKVIFGSRTIYIETAGQVGPTLSGKLCVLFSDWLIVQWPEQAAYYGYGTLAEGGGV